MNTNPNPTPQPVRIMIVEDSPTQREQLRFLLEEAGYSVVTATNGKEGLAAAKASAVDVVISDIVMPEMDGYALCKALRADPQFCHLPVILLTSLSDPQDVIRGLESGANNFICKPYEGHALLARVQNVIANQEMRKDPASEMGINICFAGKQFLVTADRLHILDLLLSTYENAVSQNVELAHVLAARKLVEEEKMRLDQRLRDQQFYTRSLFESNIDAIMTTDPRGIITDINKQMEALTGCTRDELIGAPFKNYFTDPERAEASIKQVLAGGKLTNYELTARNRDGKETVVSYNATTFYDRDRRLQGVFAAARDITESKRLDQVLQEKNVELENAKEEAESANRATSDFLSKISHELRSPLDAILGFAQLLETVSPAPTPEQKESIGQILQAGGHLLKLINEIINLKRL